MTWQASYRGVGDGRACCMVGRCVVPLQLWVRLCGKISHEPRSLGTMGRRSPSPTSDSWRGDTWRVGTAVTRVSRAMR